MPPFIHQSRVPMHATDAAGIVHFANYFRFMEEAELYALNARGFRPDNYAYPRVHVEADYRAPLRFWDAYSVAAELLSIGNSTLNWQFTITGPQGVCAVLRSTSARRSADLSTPAPYTAEERARLSDLLSDTPKTALNPQK
ncbi:MAG: thioesterase family protein [Akkermansia sp.]|nr:thioesterase family protein [Akkermansia sp.]